MIANKLKATKNKATPKYNSSIAHTAVENFSKENYNSILNFALSKVPCSTPPKRINCLTPSLIKKLNLFTAVTKGSVLSVAPNCPTFFFKSILKNAEKLELHPISWRKELDRSNKMQNKTKSQQLTSISNKKLMWNFLPSKKHHDRILALENQEQKMPIRLRPDKTWAAFDWQWKLKRWSAETAEECSQKMQPYDTFPFARKYQSRRSMIASSSEEEAQKCLGMTNGSKCKTQDTNRLKVYSIANKPNKESSKNQRKKNKKEMRSILKYSESVFWVTLTALYNIYEDCIHSHIVFLSTWHTFSQTLSHWRKYWRKSCTCLPTTCRFYPWKAPSIQLWSKLEHHKMSTNCSSNLSCL